MVGTIVHLNVPGALGRWSVRTFAGYYKINMSEAEHSIESYSSIGALFTRKLKKSIRPVGLGTCVHPADSRLTTLGTIAENTLMQAKGYKYSLSEFLVDSSALEKWKGGFYATYYLCPTDYHRVHSPVSGEVTKVTVVPGRLWPVNTWSVKAIRNLFAINERVLVEIKTAHGLVIVVLVGATNVGSMSLAFDERVRSNLGGEVRHFYYHPQVKIEKGQELGTFHMGSTVVVLYSPEFVSHLDLSRVTQAESVKMGEDLIL